MLCGFLLLAACSGQRGQDISDLPTLLPTAPANPTEDIAQAVASTLTAMSTPGIVPTDITLTPDPNATAEATPETTETPIVVTLPALAGERIPPPLNITLPADWETVGYDVQVLADVDSSIRGFPFAVYTGPVTGGVGTIVVYWGFPNLNLVSGENVAGAMSGTPLAPDLWSDGLRLLNLAVVEQGCNVGTDLRRTYRVGLASAVGTQFSAVECPGLPDTRGWFAGLQEKGLNFVFYAFVEGEAVMDNQNLEAFNAARDQLQAILDTVVFTVPDVVPTTSP